jgi:hypothetical protein
MSSIEKGVRFWMRKNVADYLDECNEYDCTRLAEDAAQKFDLYEGDDNATIPEWIFEASFAIVQEIEEEQNE